jgi:glycosyltransferase involved in cell wall biosynthesis
MGEDHIRRRDRRGGMAKDFRLPYARVPDRGARTSMRIAHVIPSLDPADGGPPAVAVRLAEAQARLGHDVLLLHLEPEPGRADAVAGLIASPPGDRRSKVRSVSNPRGLRGRLACWQGTIAGHRPEIVHVHGLWQPEILAAVRECRRAGVPYVLETYGTLNPWALRQKRLKKRIFLAIVHRRLLREAAFVHALNDVEARHIVEASGGGSVEVFPNGVFLEEFESADAARGRRAVEGLGDAPYALFLARLHPVKGLDLLADAFADAARAVPRAHLVVAGPEDVGAAGFRASIREHGLEDRVHLVGEVAGAFKKDLLRGAACFVQPSRQEGFSVSILEALAAGRAVAITEGCNFPEVAEAEAGFVVPFRRDALSTAIARLLSDPDEAARRGQNGRSLVARRYTWEAVASQCLDAYRRGLGRFTPRG